MQLGRLAIISVLGAAIPLLPCAAQSTSAIPPDSAGALTMEMRLVDSALVKRARTILERYGSTFFAIAFYVPDTAGPVRVLEMGLNESVEPRTPNGYREAYRSALRNYQRYRPQSRTLAVITDSIAGPLNEAADGADGPDLPR